jgi:hypothetical protein
MFDWYAVPEGQPGYTGFGVPDGSIVEVDGQPCPLLSAPLAPPAADYPHTPQFDYDDGPQSLQEDALARWKR